MRVLAEKVSLLVLGPTLALLVGTRFDGFFIAGLLLAVSIAGLVEWLRPAAQWSWVLCAAFLAIAVCVHAAHRLRYGTFASRCLTRNPSRGKRPLPQCLTIPGLSSFVCRRCAHSPMAPCRRTLDMGVAATHALVHPWLRLPPNAGDGAGCTARIRPGTGPSLVGCGAVRAAASAGYGSRVHSFESFAHCRYR